MPKTALVYDSPLRLGVGNRSRRRGLEDQCSVAGLWDINLSSALADGESGERRREGGIGLTKRGVVRASRTLFGALGSGLVAARVERMSEKRKEGCIVIVCFWFVVVKVEVYWEADSCEDDKEEEVGKAEEYRTKTLFRSFETGGCDFCDEDKPIGSNA